MSGESKVPMSEVGQGFFIAGLVLAEFAPKFDLADAVADANAFIAASGEKKTVIAITTITDDILGEASNMYAVRVYRRDHTLTLSQVNAMILAMNGIDPTQLGK